MPAFVRPFLCACFAVAALQATEKVPITGVRIGGAAADIAGVDAMGAKCALSDYKGQVILLDISAGWCYWCQVDAPAIQALYRTYEGQGLKVVTVLSEDVNGAGPVTVGNLKSWVSTYGLTFRVQNDASGGANGVAEKVYVAATGGFPTLAIIDKGFKVQYLEGGYDANAVQAKVAALLAQ